jgi:hypothetical protein
MADRHRRQGRRAGGHQVPARRGRRRRSLGEPQAGQELRGQVEAEGAAAIGHGRRARRDRGAQGRLAAGQVAGRALAARPLAGHVQREPRIALGLGERGQAREPIVDGAGQDDRAVQQIGHRRPSAIELAEERVARGGVQAAEHQGPVAGGEPTADREVAVGDSRHGARGAVAAGGAIDGLGQGQESTCVVGRGGGPQGVMERDPARPREARRQRGLDRAAALEERGLGGGELGQGALAGLDRSAQAVGQGPAPRRSSRARRRRRSPRRRRPRCAASRGRAAPRRGSTPRPVRGRQPTRGRPPREPPADHRPGAPAPRESISLPGVVRRRQRGTGPREIAAQHQGPDVGPGRVGLEGGQVGQREPLAGDGAALDAQRPVTIERRVGDPDLDGAGGRQGQARRRRPLRPGARDPPADRDRRRRRQPDGDEHRGRPTGAARRQGAPPAPAGTQAWARPRGAGPGTAAAARSPPTAASIAIHPARSSWQRWQPAR